MNIDKRYLGYMTMQKEYEKKLMFYLNFLAIMVLFLIVSNVFFVNTSNINAPLGSDFGNFYIASVDLLNENVNRIYDLKNFYEDMKSFFGHELDYERYFSYPPVYFLLIYGLAFFPYFLSYALWNVTGYLCLATALRQLCSWRMSFVIALANPAMNEGVVTGQNGAYTATFLGGGLTLLEKSPIAGGALLGALVMKPQIGLLVPVALLASRSWSALFAFTASALGLVGLSVLLFGFEAWVSYFQVVGHTGDMVLKYAYFALGMTSVYASLRSFGVSEYAAYAVQISVSITMMILVFVFWSKGGINKNKLAFLVLACVFSTPYLFHYDLVMLSFIPVWLLSDDKPNKHKNYNYILYLSLILLFSYDIAKVFVLLYKVNIGLLFAMPLLFYVCYINFLNLKHPVPHSA